MLNEVRSRRLDTFPKRRNILQQLESSSAHSPSSTCLSNGLNSLIRFVKYIYFYSVEDINVIYIYKWSIKMRFVKYDSEDLYINKFGNEMQTIPSGNESEIYLTEN